MIIVRILTNIILLFSIFILPWWVVIPISLALAFYFNFYLEVVLAALAFDLIYAPVSFFVGAYFITFFVLLFFVVIEFLKRKVILNSKS